MSDPVTTATVDLSPALLLGPYGVTLVCAAFQQFFNRRPLGLALVLSLLVSVVMLADGALTVAKDMQGSLPWALFLLRYTLLFIFGGFAVFSAALGMNTLSSPNQTFGAAAAVAPRRWSSYWFD